MIHGMEIHDRTTWVSYFLRLGVHVATAGYVKACPQNVCVPLASLDLCVNAGALRMTEIPTAMLCVHVAMAASVHTLTVPATVPKGTEISGFLHFR